MKLLLSAITKMIFGIALIGAMLFLPAWTFNYAGAWLFIGVLFVPMLVVGLVLFLKAPDLLQKRIDYKEKEKTQKGVIGLSGLMFPVCFVISALDFRFSWSRVPMWLSIAAAAIFLVGYILYAEVLRENAYLSRKVEIQDGQKVIDTGLYGIIRHPMYFATLLMFIPMPLILQSLWGLVPIALYPVLIVIRIINEEKVLSEGLDGYCEYKAKVKKRLLPFIW